MSNMQAETGAQAPAFSARRGRRSPNLEVTVTYKWRSGFHPPDVDPGVVAKAAKGHDPDSLLEASKARKHPLHAELWSEGDGVWAERGRRERCRQIMAAVVNVRVVGGQKVEVRSFEHLRQSKRWATIEEILADPELELEHMAAIRELNVQAAAKMQRLLELKSMRSGLPDA